MRGLTAFELGYNTNDQQLVSVQLNSNLTKEYGVKGDCCFNHLQYFHCANGFPADVAHDFFEGVLLNIMTYLIVVFVEAGYFSLPFVNEQIENFPYARCDKKDKPQPFTLSALTTFKVKLTAAESWNFVRLFPLMFGIFVPKDSPYWLFLGNLLDYVEFVTALKFDKALTYYLDEKYEEVFTEFVSLFPDKTVTPKMHYGIHYGKQTRDFGPPRSRFTLRYESKNHSIKEPITRSKNRKNVCLTMAYRHQYRMYLHYRNEKFF